jgi:hypothetical protein
MKRNALVEPMNLVESMEKIVKISKASGDGKLVARSKF